MPDQPPLRSFGRTKGRPLKPRQARLLEILLPQIALPEEGQLELHALFPRPRGRELGGGGVQDESQALLRSPTSSVPSERPPFQPSPRMGEGYTLEIGFGGGEHLVAQAAAHPEIGFLGVEPFQNGVAQCLAHTEDAGLANIRLHQGDARDVLARLPDASLTRVFILFPDPWPKTRHHKRRLIQPDFIAELARVLAPHGEVRFATDWAHYAAWTLERFLREPRFTWLAESAADWRAPWEGHVPTRYEQKRLGDCPPVWLRFARR